MRRLFCWLVRPSSGSCLGARSRWSRALVRLRPDHRRQPRRALLATPARDHDAHRLLLHACLTDLTHACLSRRARRAAGTARPKAGVSSDVGRRGTHHMEGSRNTSAAAGENGSPNAAGAEWSAAAPHVRQRPRQVPCRSTSTGVAAFIEGQRVLNAWPAALLYPNDTPVVRQPCQIDTPSCFACFSCLSCFRPYVFRARNVSCSTTDTSHPR
jgi:hypothetical protein